MLRRGVASRVSACPMPISRRHLQDCCAALLLWVINGYRRHVETAHSGARCMMMKAMCWWTRRRWGNDARTTIGPKKEASWNARPDAVQFKMKTISMLRLTRRVRRSENRLRSLDHCWTFVHNFLLSHRWDNRVMVAVQCRTIILTG